MKKILLAALLIAVLMLTGCQPLGDMTDLMSPPKLTVEQQAVEKALADTLGKNKYQLKYPLEGAYRSSFLFHDLDGDGIDEAIAFYCPSTENAGMHVMILRKKQNKWVKADDFSGDGNEVDQVDFGNFYGTGKDEVAIAWTQLTGTDLQLGVYAISGKKYTSTSTFTTMKAVEMTGDGKTDILLFKLDSAAHQAAATLLSCQGGKFGPLAKARMDPTVSHYAGIYLNRSGSQNTVLIDGYKGAHGMVTELLCFQNGKLVSPLLDSRNGTVSKTMRQVPISCEDINNDGEYEIPNAVELPGYGKDISYSDKLWLISWRSVSSGQISEAKLPGVMNNGEEYYFTFPQNYVKNVTVDDSSGDGNWAFRVWDGKNSKMGELLFRIVVFTESSWRGNHLGESSGNSFELAEKNGLVYAGMLYPKTAGNTPYYLDVNVIRQNFHLIS